MQHVNTALLTNALASFGMIECILWLSVGKCRSLRRMTKAAHHRYGVAHGASSPDQ